jgi:hypothetical protein
MIKVLISLVIIVAVGLGIWQVLEYWQKVQDDKETTQKQATSGEVNPDSLAGLPQGWDVSLKAAEDHGSTTLGAWLKSYGAQVRDPRKAWIQLDYVLLITREDPKEAKRIFAEVRDRTPPNSPVWPRIQQLQKSYQ